MKNDFSDSAAKEEEEGPFKDYLILHHIREDQSIPKRHIREIDFHFVEIMVGFEKEYKKVNHSNWSFKKHFLPDYMEDCANFVASSLVDNVDFNCDQITQLNSKFTFNRMGTNITITQSSGFHGTKPDLNAAKGLSL